MCLIHCFFEKRPQQYWWCSDLKTSKCFFLYINFFLYFYIVSLREWNVERLQVTAQKVLPHPSFVYSARYHPTAQNLVVTGGYDCLIRVWRVDVGDVNGQLLQEFEGHGSFINTVCFDSEGTVSPVMETCPRCVCVCVVSYCELGKLGTR